MEKITIKRITLQDIELVVDLFDQYRIFYKQQSNLEVARAFILDRLRQNESIIFVAISEESNRPVGFTQLYPTFSSMRVAKNWILNDLYVVLDARKMGIGRKLILEAMHFAKTENATFLKLSTAVDNFTAQQLYESMGFVRLDVDEEFYDYKISLS